MADYIGNIAVPEVAPVGVFPLTPDFPHGQAQEPHVVVHQFGSANAKISSALSISAARIPVFYPASRV